MAGTSCHECCTSSVGVECYYGLQVVGVFRTQRSLYLVVAGTHLSCLLCVGDDVDDVGPRASRHGACEGATVWIAVAVGSLLTHTISYACYVHFQERIYRRLLAFHCNPAL